MALDKLVDSSVLDAAMRYTANRIRAKTGESENLPFDMSAENPKGFGDAVDGIQTGSTPTGTKQITITANGTTTEDVAAYASAEITVNVPSSAGEEPIIPDPIKDVVFVDYDGEIVEQYTAAEFLALTALPANPSHTGLVAQGWNWSLANAQEYVAKWGCLVIGQNYTTDDGKTRYYLHITEQIYPKTLSIPSRVPSGSSLRIDWGDGESTTVSGTNADVTSSHTYANGGDYVVTLTFTGSFAIGSSAGGAVASAAARAVYAVELGNNITAVNRSAFNAASNLRTVSIPANIKNFSGYVAGTGNAFAGGNIKCVVFPAGTTTVGPLGTIRKFVSFPKGLTAVSAFANSVLRALTLPEGGSWAMDTNYTLTRAERISFPSKAATIGGGSWSTTFISSAYCRKFTIPSGVTSIKAHALANMSGILELHILPTTPPALAATDGISISSAGVIYVPYSEDHSILEAYQTATNWSNFASKMQEEPQS